MISLKNKNIINNLVINESTNEILTDNIPTYQRYQEHIQDITDIFSKNFSGSSTISIVTPTSSTSSTGNSGSSAVGKSKTNTKGSQIQNRKNNLPTSQNKLGTVQSGIGKRNKAPWELSTWEKIKKNWKGIATVAGIIGVTGLGAYGYFKLKDPGSINEKIKILDEQQIKQFIILNKTFLSDINKIIDNTIELKFDVESFLEQYKSISGHYQLLDKFITELKNSDAIEETEKDKSLRELEKIKSHFKDTVKSFINKNEKRNDLDLQASNSIQGVKTSWNNLIKESAFINKIILEKLLKVNKNLISKLNNKNNLNEIAPLVGAAARIAAPTIIRSIPKLRRLGTVASAISPAGSKRYKEISFWEKIKNNWKKIAITIGSLGLAGLGTYAAYKGYKDYKGRSFEKLSQTTRKTLENEFENTLKKIKILIKSYKDTAFDFNLIKKCVEQKSFLPFKPEFELIISQYNSLIHIKRALDGIENSELKNKLISDIYSICRDFKTANNNRINLTVLDIDNEIEKIEESIEKYENESKKYKSLSDMASEEIINNINSIRLLSIIPQLKIPAMTVSYFSEDIKKFSSQILNIDKGLFESAVNDYGNMTPDKLKTYIINNKSILTANDLETIMEFLSKRCDLIVQIYRSEMEILNQIKHQLSVTLDALNDMILDCKLEKEININTFKVFLNIRVTRINLNDFNIISSPYTNNNNLPPESKFTIPPLPIGRGKGNFGGSSGLGMPGSGVIPTGLPSGGGGIFSREMRP